jgi:hypothetical protein
MDLFHRIVRWIDHNRWNVLCLIVAAAIVVTGIACRPRTRSLTGDNQVTYEQFEAEAIEKAGTLAEQRTALSAAVQAFNARAETFQQQVRRGREDLERQAKIHAQLIELLGGAATGALSGNFSPQAFIVPGLSLLAAAFGVGKTLDNRRKDRVIRDLKMKTHSPPTAG